MSKNEWPHFTREHCVLYKPLLSNHQQTLDPYCNAICECLIHSAIVAQIKKKAKLRHYITRLKQGGEKVSRAKDCDALAKNCLRDFWKEVIKVNSTKYRGRTAPVIDGVAIRESSDCWVMFNKV